MFANENWSSNIFTWLNEGQNNGFGCPNPQIANKPE